MPTAADDKLLGVIVRSSALVLLVYIFVDYIAGRFVPWFEPVIMVSLIPVWIVALVVVFRNAIRENERTLQEFERARQASAAATPQSDPRVGSPAGPNREFENEELTPMHKLDELARLLKDQQRRSERLQLVLFFLAPLLGIAISFLASLIFHVSVR
jgi:hypothetical protein